MFSKRNKSKLLRRKLTGKLIEKIDTIIDGGLSAFIFERDVLRDLGFAESDLQWQRKYAIKNYFIDHGYFFEELLVENEMWTLVFTTQDEKNSLIEQLQS